jgi:CD36 family
MSTRGRSPSGHGIGGLYGTTANNLPTEDITAAYIHTVEDNPNSNGSVTTGEVEAAETPYPSPYPSLLDPPDEKPYISERQAVCCTSVGVAVLLIGIVTFVVTLTIVPAALKDHVSDVIQSYYVPRPGETGYQGWVSTEGPDPVYTEYDVFYLYNISNADEVMFNASLPIMKEMGPFVYRRYTRKLSVQYPSADAVSYVEQQYYEVVNTPFSMVLANYEIVSLRPANPDLISLRMFDASVFAQVTQMSNNPLNDQRIENFRKNCSSSAQTLLKCIDTAFAKGSGGSVNLNTTLTDLSGGLLPLRSASEWLGVVANAAVQNKFWHNMNMHVLGISQFRNEKWAYRINTTQLTQSFAMAEVLPQTMHSNAEAIGQAMTYRKWDGMAILQNVLVTFPSRLWNVLSYMKLFAGWGADVAVEGYLSERHTHPNLDVDGVDSELLLWSPEMVRPLLFQSIEGDAYLKGVHGRRYLLSDSNFALTKSANQVFFQTENGVANVTQTKSYSPLFVTTPHFFGYPELSVTHHLPGVRQGSTADQSFFDVDPKTGLPLDGLMQLQTNVRVPNMNFSGTTAARFHMHQSESGGLLVPAYIMQRFRICSNSMAGDLRDVQRVPNVRYYVVLGGALGGSVLVLLGIVVFLRGVQLKRRAREQEARPIYGTSSALLYDSSR